MDLINFQGSYINILGAIDNRLYILGFIQPRTAIWSHVWNENKITKHPYFTAKQHLIK